MLGARSSVDGVYGLDAVVKTVAVLEGLLYRKSDLTPEEREALTKAIIGLELLDRKQKSTPTVERRTTQSRKNTAENT